MLPSVRQWMNWIGLGLFDIWFWIVLGGKWLWMYSFKNCQNLGELFFTHRVKLRELLELSREIQWFHIFIGIWNHNFFMFLILISTFKSINLWYDSIVNKKRSVDLVNKHGFYYVSIVIWLFDNLIVFWPQFWFLKKK